jgi:hypothetical protein
MTGTNCDYVVTVDLVLIAHMVGILGAGFWAKRKVISQEQLQEAQTQGDP